MTLDDHSGWLCSGYLSLFDGSIPTSSISFSDHLSSHVATISEDKVPCCHMEGSNVTLCQYHGLPIFKLKQIKSLHLIHCPFPYFCAHRLHLVSPPAGRGELHVCFSLLRRNTPHCYLDRVQRMRPPLLGQRLQYSKCTRLKRHVTYYLSST